MKNTTIYLKIGCLVVLPLMLLSLTPSPQYNTLKSDLKSKGNLGNPQGLNVQNDLGKIPLYFIANQGQKDSQVDFYVQGSDKSLYFTPEGITMSLRYPQRSFSTYSRKMGRSLPYSRIYRGNDGKFHHWIVQLDFVGANPVQPIGQEKTQAIISYFKGSPDKWHVGLPTYSKIIYYNLWEGIDLVFSGTFDQLKYEFRIQPRSDPDVILMNYRGAKVRINQSGQLEVKTPTGSFKDDVPIAYQQVNGTRVPVNVSYMIVDSATYGFRLGAYDPTLPLVIDPAMLVYCGYIGGNGRDYGRGIAVDQIGNIYITGQTDSDESTFPVRVGPDLSYNTDSDAFVAKINSDGTELIYVGYIGGDINEWGETITVDSAGNAYVTGYTGSDELYFPVIVGPDLSYNGYGDGFVAKVSADGTELKYCGYIGGSGADEGNGIAVDAEGNVYITGYTSSYESTFPETVGPDLSYNGGSYDAFVMKLKSDGTGFIYAGYIGGKGRDIGFGVALDPAGNAYIAGETASSEASFPEKIGPDFTYNGNTDAFIAKVSEDGTGLEYAGYIGGTEIDGGWGIAVDSSGNAYVTGRTDSSEDTFPDIIGPDLTYNGGTDTFIAKVKSDGSGLVYAGYFGGVGEDLSGSIGLDAAGNAYIAGRTNSTEETFPATVGPDLTYNGGEYDAFVAKVKADGTMLMYAGYIGGDNEDRGLGIAVDKAGNAYITGYTESSESSFPAIIGPDLTYHGGPEDVFVAKVSSTIYIYLPIITQ